MKTKIIMMTALLALLATGCGKDGDGRIRIIAENMTAASNGSKVQINPSAPVNGEQWIAGEYINVNSTSLPISGNDEDGYSVASQNIALVGGALYAIYPGQTQGGNVVTIDHSNTSAPSITLNNLVVDYNGDGTHKVVFPMGAKADGETTTILFKHLTAGFRLTLNASTPVTLNKLKVIVYGDAEAEPVVLNGVSYTVKWAEQAPSVPSGATGSITDRDVSFASEMNFDLKTSGAAGVEISSSLQLCIPVTLATVRRITVVGYDGTGNEVFSKTSTMAGGDVALERNTIYPVAAITVN